MKKVYIIAEAGVNHNGSKDIAFKLVDAAVEAGVDAIKFQTFKAENIAITSVDKAGYQKQIDSSNETCFEMLKKLEMSYEMHYEVMNYCKKKGIEFLSTAFDIESLDFLVTKLNLKTLKIPSGEITNAPLLLEYAKTGCDLILSTGMATLGEIEDALGILSYGLLNYSCKDLSKKVFKNSLYSTEGQKIIKDKVTILHCTTEYPAPFLDINLNAISTMYNAFGLKVGYSDHSEGITIPIAATVIGAVLIEKHFTLDKTLPGPDHKASINPNELIEMVGAIRAVEKAMGDGVKRPMQSELKNISIARKSLVAITDIKKGEKFTEDNVAVKRPGSGINPMEYWDVIGSLSPINIKKDSLIKL